MLKMPYKVLFDKDDFRKLSGYSLEKLNQGDFINQEEAQIQFMEEAAQSIYHLIANNRGIEFANDSQDDESMKNAIGLAQCYEAIYFFENGNLALSATPLLEGQRIHSKRAIECLLQNGVLKVEVL